MAKQSWRTVSIRQAVGTTLLSHAPGCHPTVAIYAKPTSRIRRIADTPDSDGKRRSRVRGLMLVMSALTMIGENLDHAACRDMAVAASLIINSNSALRALRLRIRCSTSARRARAMRSAVAHG